MEETETLESFLKRHPWPEALKGTTQPVEGLWSIRLRSSPTELWPWVSDTSRFNRALGIAEMQFEEIEGVLRGSSRNAGVLQTWTEVPWDWVTERTLTSVREYDRGLSTIARAIYELRALDSDQTQFVAYFGFVPRSFWHRPILRMGLGWLESGYRRVLAEIDERIGNTEGSDPYEPPPSVLNEGAPARLASAWETLSREGADREAAERLVALVRTGDPMDLVRMQPLSWAKQWGLAEDSVLEAFLHAARAGLLQMSWDVMCPHCRGVREEVRVLGEVPSRGVCDVCEIDFDTDGENALEITFRVHRSIRDVPQVFYCSAEPSKKVHMQLQQRLGPEETREVTTALAPGKYRARCKGSYEFRLLDVTAEGPNQAELRADDLAGGDERCLDVGPGATLTLENPTTEPQTLVVEQLGWSGTALRPRRLLSFQKFRDLFADEYVGTDVQLGVGEQTVLFTDVVGSTALYDEKGDPGAFMAVKEHFTHIYEEVVQHQGAVVKTIGDAVMAAFNDPVHALRASERIHQRLPPGEGLRVRITLNTGPCIAVNLNSNIDYFGATVNVAAKLQSYAEAGEITFAEAVLRAPGASEWLEERQVDLERLDIDLKAISKTIRAHRWNVNGSPRP